MATFGTFTSGQVLTAEELNSAGAWQDYTPTWTQNATITKTVNWARYTKLNKWVQVSIKMTATSAGTANNVIKVGLPVNAATNNGVIGSLLVTDQDTSTSATRLAFFDSASTVKFYNQAGGIDLATEAWGQTGGGNVAITIASGDVVYVQLTYEAA
jgi:hypothetical protein